MSTFRYIATKFEVWLLKRRLERVERKLAEGRRAMRQIVGFDDRDAPEWMKRRAGI